MYIYTYTYRSLSIYSRIPISFSFYLVIYFSNIFTSCSISSLTLFAVRQHFRIWWKLFVFPRFSHTHTAIAYHLIIGLTLIRFQLHWQRWQRHVWKWGGSIFLAAKDFLDICCCCFSFALRFSAAHARSCRCQSFSSFFGYLLNLNGSALLSPFFSPFLSHHWFVSTLRRHARPIAAAIA